MNVSGAHPSSPKFKTVTFCSNVDAGPDVITFYTYPETTPRGITRMEITDGGQFKVRAEGLDLSGIDPNNPIPFSLQIGNDIGETEIQLTDQ